MSAGQVMPYTFQYNWKPATVEMEASALLKSWGFCDTMVYTQIHGTSKIYTDAVNLDVETVKSKLQELGFMLDTPIIDNQGNSLSFRVKIDGGVDKIKHVIARGYNLAIHDWKKHEADGCMIWLEAALTLI